MQSALPLVSMSVELNESLEFDMHFGGGGSV